MRGSVDGWDFKSYVLGVLFYRFISEKIENNMNELERSGNSTFSYRELTDDAVENADAALLRKDLVSEVGTFLFPSELFHNVCKKAIADENLNETLNNVFQKIGTAKEEENSAKIFKNLFNDLDFNSPKLGNTVLERNEKIVKILYAIRDLDLGDFSNHEIDAFGDAYEFLMQMYASNAGKSGGEYYTPQEVSELLAKITIGKKDQVESVYDPACGSGSLLLKFAKILEGKNVGHFYGQEINITTYNLARINMILHNIDHSKIDIANGDTLRNPAYMDKKFECIVSNPPYSIRWAGDSDPILIDDVRFSSAGVLAPKSKADLAFTMHMVHYLKENGVAAIVEFPGVLYRGGAEKTIREYLLKENLVDAVIQLPPDLFFGTTIGTCIIVLKKSCRKDQKVLFIDASEEFVRSGNKNKLSMENQLKILETIEKREDIPYFAKLVDNNLIRENQANLSVSSYVEKDNKKEEVNIVELNAEIQRIVARQQKLRIAIDAIVADLEGSV